MGYTHYWHHDRDFHEDEWKKICNEFKRILKKTNDPDSPVTINGNTLRLAGWDGTGEPEVTDDIIRFNGTGAESHETMILTRKVTKAWDFCKTNKKPYDAAVVTLLAKACRVSPGALRLSSDGSGEYKGGVFRKLL